MRRPEGDSEGGENLAKWRVRSSYSAHDMLMFHREHSFTPAPCLHVRLLLPVGGDPLALG